MDAILMIQLKKNYFRISNHSLGKHSMALMFVSLLMDKLVVAKHSQCMELTIILVYFLE